jgi:hypothetical protein
MTTNRIDIDALRLTSTLSDELMGEEMKAPIEVRKPGKQTFFRVHPDAAYKLNTALLWIDDETRWFLPSPAMMQHIGDELTIVRIVTCIDLCGDISLWPVKLPSSEGRASPWHQSAMVGADQAASRWTRLTADMKKQRYRIFLGGSDLPEPEWPERTFSEMINEAFAEYHITTADHPVIKKLRGRK